MLLAVHLLSYGCTWELFGKHEGTLSPRATSSFIRSKFSSTFSCNTVISESDQYVAAFEQCSLSHRLVNPVLVILIWE